MEAPLVSVIINNYNYGHFLREAVDSALCQTYQKIEVIVVDDGSTDHSREIIASYGNRILPVLKENGGQASAFNAGFKISRGDIICFLDSDDIFLPNKVEEMVKAWRQYPNAVLYYHQMQLVNTQGIHKGRPWPFDLWTGSIKKKIEHSGGWWPRPTTSALCFSHQYLRQVLPMPEDGFELCADAYIGDLAPFYGTIYSVPEALTLYRQHGNNYFSKLLTREPEGIRRRAKQYVFEYEQLKKAPSGMGIDASFDLNRHLPYLVTTYLLEQKPPLWRMFLLTLSCPLLGCKSRIYQLAKLIMKRF
jgi:glycosyltransferase involved in cell wall biosynthesis